MTDLQLWRTLGFEHPWRLLLLAVPVCLAVWELSRRGPRVTLPFDHGDHLPRRWLPKILALSSLLPPLVLATAIVIFARPLAAGKPKEERSLTNIEFVLDVSGSMTSRFGDATQYDAAMQAIADFTRHRKGDAFGLTIFGNQVLRWTPVTKDLSAIAGATPFVRPELMPHQFGGTEIGRAVLFCRDGLTKRGEGDRLMVLFSDGASADLGPSRSRSIGAELAASRIVLYAVHVGPGGAPADLVELCRPTGGRVFAAGSPEALTDVFAHIDRMQPVRVKPTAVERVDFLKPFTLLGLIGAALLGVCLCGLRYAPW
jgi:Ca-activated chloride channel homolog